MKIAIIAGRDPDFKNDTDGGSIFLKNLTKELVKRNHNVDIFTPLKVSGGVFDKKKIIKASKKKFNGKLKIHRFPIKHIQTLNKNGNSENYFLNRIKLSHEIAKFFENKNLFSYNLVYILHIANAFQIIKKDLTPINRTILFPMMTSPYYRLFSTVPKIYIKHEKETLRKIKHISSPSLDEIKTIKKFFEIPEEKIFKTNRGFDNNVFLKNVRGSIYKKSSINLFSANGIRPQKNHLFFIPLVKKLMENSIKVRVHLTGNDGNSHNKMYNEYAKNFWLETTRNNLEKNFISYGIVSEKKLAHIMDTSDIAIYPSIAETFGKSALESMATGLPTIVGSNLSAYNEFIENGVTGISVELKPEVFVKEIINLINNPNYYHKISRNGIKKGHLFTWRKVINDFFKTQKQRLII